MNIWILYMWLTVVIFLGLALAEAVSSTGAGGQWLTNMMVTYDSCLSTG